MAQGKLGSDEWSWTVYLSEPWADTTSYAGKMALTVSRGIAQFERDLTCDRTSTGRVAAKKRDVRFGRPAKLNPEPRELAAQLLEEGKSPKQVTIFVKAMFPEAVCTGASPFNADLLEHGKSSLLSSRAFFERHYAKLHMIGKC